jgi:microcystin-dependent protein
MSFAQMPGDLYQILLTIVGEGYVLNDKESLDEYGHDQTEDLQFPPQIIVRPRSAEEISKVLSLCNQHRIPVTPRGAGTGLSGGALPHLGGVLISMDRMNSIIEIDEQNLQVITEPGVITEVLQNMVSVYEESDGTLSFQNLKATGDTALKRVIVNSTFILRDGLSNTGGGIINSGSGGISNIGGNLTNRGKFINTGSAKITESLEVMGDISGNLVSLRGMIVMWSGSIATIPDGWKLCDGQTYNGIKTPDLRSRFVLGASLTGSTLDTGLTLKTVNDVSGTEIVTLTEAQMPSHSHEYSIPWWTNTGVQNTWPSAGGNWGNYENRTRTPATGGNQPHNNMPPYYALAYIMKV